MYQRAPVVTSSLVLIFVGLFSLIYPPSLLRLSQAYVGSPVGDKDLELRLEASEKFGYATTDYDAWESTSLGCGFRFNYNTDSSVLGNIISLDYGPLCNQEKGLDLYAVQGVEISTPYEDPAEANDTTHYEDAFNWCRFSDFDLLRHVVPLGHVDLTILGVSEEESLTTW
ncbi:unnamed protein product, partial [Ascophyllum nodosum]